RPTQKPAGAGKKYPPLMRRTSEATEKAAQAPKGTMAKAIVSSVNNTGLGMWRVLLQTGHSQQRPDCVAGHVGLELRNVGKNYPFERSRRFPGSSQILATETFAF